MEYLYQCPKCGKVITYKQEKSYHKAKEKNQLCRSCRDASVKYVRVCPICGVSLSYKRKSDYMYAIRNNTKCIQCRQNSGQFKKGQCTSTVRNLPTYSLDRLLDMSNQSMYWLGVILADGSFHRNGFEISFKAEDLEFLQRLGTYINYNNALIKYRSSSNSYRLSFSNKHALKKVQDKFDIHQKKTYNPCNFKFYDTFTTEQLMCLLIGLIDGDGHISKNGEYITITAHEVWYDFYNKLISKLGLNFHINKSKNRPILSIRAGKLEVKKTLKNFILDKELLVLERKWNRLKI